MACIAWREDRNGCRSAGSSQSSKAAVGLRHLMSNDEAKEVIVSGELALVAALTVGFLEGLARHYRFVWAAPQRATLVPRVSLADLRCVLAQLSSVAGVIERTPERLGEDGKSMHLASFPDGSGDSLAANLAASRCRGSAPGRVARGARGVDRRPEAEFLDRDRVGHSPDRADTHRPCPWR